MLVLFTPCVAYGEEVCGLLHCNLACLGVLLGCQPLGWNTYQVAEPVLVQSIVYKKQVLLHQSATKHWVSSMTATVHSHKSVQHDFLAYRLCGGMVCSFGAPCKARL